MATETSIWRVSLSDIDLGPDEEAAVLEVLRSKWLTLGPRTAGFESAFAERVGARHAVATSNCTTALHLAMLAVGVGPGDEVLVPSLTFVATVNAVLYCGGTPVFVDVTSEEDLSFDVEDAARKVGPRTKAMAPVHYAGYPCDMDALLALARERGLRVVEDAAHAPGASWKGRPVGALGDVSCFSFFGNKNLVTGEGGMITTDDDALASFARLHRSHGMTALSYDKARGHAFSYDVVSAGYNYRMTEIQAALGLVQLAKLDGNNARRREIVEAYRRRLSRLPGVRMPYAGRAAESSCHILPVLLPPGTDRDALQARMREAGVQTSVHYRPVHRFANFTRYRADVPRTEALEDRLLTLPLHPLMSADDVEVVVAALEQALA